MKAIATLVLVGVVATACDRSAEELEQRVLELQTAAAQKDSLIDEVMASTQFVSDLSADLAAVRALNAGRPTATQASDVEGMTPAEIRATVRERVRELGSRVDQSEAQLAQSRARVQTLTSSNASMQGQLAAFDSTIISLQVVLESQRAEVAVLSQQVLGLQMANVELAQQGEQLTAEKQQLASTVDAMTVESNRVYYVIGTADELRDQGIVEKHGGFLGMGGTYTPSRTLETSDFMELDRMRDSVIAFPDPAKTYQVVSIQDTRYLATQPDKDNKIRAGLKIASPEMFWGPSKFLILVER